MRPQRLSYRGDRVEIQLPPELVANVQAICNRYEVTLEMALLAIFRCRSDRLPAVTTSPSAFHMVVAATRV